MAEAPIDPRMVKWDDAAPIDPRMVKWDSGPSSPQGMRESIVNRVGATFEPFLNIGTGAIAAPVSGLAGMAYGITNALGATNTPPGDVVRSVGGALTYEPKTEGGKAATDFVTKPFQWLAQGADAAGGRVAEATGSPAVGAGVNTAIQMAVPSALLKGASKIPLRKQADLSPEVNLLAEKNIPMTPGQIRGGWINTVEQAFQSIPFIGDIVKNARGQGTAELNRAVVNDAIKPLGVELPKGMTGHDAVQYARQTLGDAYDALLPKMKGTLDDNLRTNLDLIKAGGGNLPRQQRRDLNRIIDENVIKQFENGTVTGQTLKDIQSNLSKEIADYGKGGTYERKVAESLKEVQSAIRDMVRRDNPEYSAQLQAIDSGYAKFKVVQNAAAKGKDGMFTPLQLLQAVKQKDFTKDKRAFSEGTAGAGMQPLAEAAQKVLPTQLADSGTPTRAMVAGLALGGGGAGLGALLNPVAGLTFGSIPLMYSNAGMRAMQHLMMRPPAISSAALRAAPVGLLQSAQE